MWATPPPREIPSGTGTGWAGHARHLTRHARISDGWQWLPPSTPAVESARGGVVLTQKRLSVGSERIQPALRILRRGLHLGPELPGEADHRSEPAAHLVLCRHGACDVD